MANDLATTEAPRGGGPKTPGGIEASKYNALRHGLRSMRPVIPGEDAGAWEAHRAAVLEGLAPEGVLEEALADQIASKLWRVGRVVRHEADLIANLLDPDEMSWAHEKAAGKHLFGRRLTPPGLDDIQAAEAKLARTRERLAALDEAARLVEGLGAMAPDEGLPWDFSEELVRGLNLSLKVLDHIEEGEHLSADRARRMIERRGAFEDVVKALADYWRGEFKAKLTEDVSRLESEAESVRSRYEAALDRLRRSRGLPDVKALEKIQRYEAHLERGLHRAIDRLCQLQEARGAVPARPPKTAVAVAMVPSGDNPASSFGKKAIEGGVEGA